MITKNNKIKIVERLTENFKKTEAVIVSQYSGIDVNELNGFRKTLKKEGYEAKVLKNNLAKIAFDNNKISFPENILKGPNIYISTTDDVVGLSKLIVDYSKKNDSLVIKGGILNKDYIDVSQINVLAKLPSREELIAKAIGMMKSPITGLVMTLSSPVNGLVNVLNNIKSKNTGGDK